MDASVEKDCSILEALFHQVIADMKNGFAVWEDFSSKGSRLHTALKTTMLCMNAFLESFQKVADMASGTKGSTKEIGSALTRLCLRQRSIESRLKLFTNSILDSLVLPMMEKLEEWKKSLAVMDRDHAREYKKGHQEVKKSHAEAQKEQKKLKKIGGTKQEGTEKLYKSANEKLLQLRENEMNAVIGALIEERHRLCLFVACLKPVMDEEISLLSEVTHLHEIVENLCLLADAPDSLPPSGEQVICDAIGRNAVISSRTASDCVSPPIHQTQQSQLTRQSTASTCSRQQSSESPSSGPSAGSSVNNSLDSSPSKTVGKLQQQQRASVLRQSSAGDDVNDGSKDDVRAGNVAAVSTVTSPVELSMTSPTCVSPSQLPPFSTSLLSAASSQIYQQQQQHHDFAHLLRHKETCSASATPAEEEVCYLDPLHPAGCRPHTISYIRERGSARPHIGADTYAPRDSSMGSMLTSGSGGEGSPYAMPCIIPKRRSTRVGQEKVADIYARPSLVQSHGGYRTPNIKPLPVATPTVPDSSNVPAFPLTGYVNMNQLANMAFHQNHPTKQRDNRDSMPDIESLRHHAHKQQSDLFQSCASTTVGTERHVSSRDHRRQISLDASQMAKLSEGGCSGSIDLSDLAARLGRACRLQGASDPWQDWSWTLPRQPPAVQRRSTSHFWQRPSLSSSTFTMSSRRCLSPITDTREPPTFLLKHGAPQVQPCLKHAADAAPSAASNSRKADGDAPDASVRVCCNQDQSSV